MVASSTVIEGRTKLSVPTSSLGTPEPPTSPVFFNPAASVNRDITVALTCATSGKTFLDSLAGVGARGVRVAKEVDREVQVTLLDFNDESLAFARQSVKLNSVERTCSVVSGEANTYLHSRFGRDQRFDYVDVDPFGSPAAFVQGAARATAGGGIISLTATDTAVLCGVYPAVARRRYGIAAMSNHFRHETGLRVLLNFLRRTAAGMDIGVSPVLAHSTRHYMRVYARIEVGASKADRAMTNEGYLAECASCGHIWAAPHEAGACAKCSGKVRVAGPVWVGSLVDEGLVRLAAGRAGELGLGAAAAVLKSLQGVGGLPPFGYSVESICSALRVPSVSDMSVIEGLERLGHRCCRQPFEKTGIKSDAEYAEVLQVVKDLSGSLA